MKGSISFACFPVTRERALLFDNFIVQRIFYFPSAVPEGTSYRSTSPDGQPIQETSKAGKAPTLRRTRSEGHERQRH